MDKNKLVLPITILVASFIIGSFYYTSEANKQASIERQHQEDLQAQQAAQQADLRAKQDAQQAITDQNNLIANEKAACVSEAQQTAISEYNDAYCTGAYPANDCYKGTYLVPQYQNAYDTCLESKGLK